MSEHEHVAIVVAEIPGDAIPADETTKAKQLYELLAQVMYEAAKADEVTPDDVVAAARTR